VFASRGLPEPEPGERCGRLPGHPGRSL
jgi:hypothetical protein